MNAAVEPRQAETDQLPPGRRSWWLVAVLVVVALVAGAAGGWLARGGADETATYAIAGGGGPTDRQREMMALLDGYIRAWTENDGDAVATYFAPRGVFEYAGQGVEYSVDDGSLQAWVSDGVDHSDMVFDEPATIMDNWFVGTGTVLGIPFVSVIQFTESGDLEIVRESIFYS